MEASLEPVLSLIPQRQPFVMIDQLISSGDKASQTELLVRADNIFVVNNEFTEPGLVENIAQTAAARAGYVSRKHKQEVPVGYIGAIKNLEIFALPKVNDRLQTNIEIENQVFNVTVISGKIWCNDVLMATCEMKIFLSQNK